MTITTRKQPENAERGTSQEFEVFFNDAAGVHGYMNEAGVFVPLAGAPVPSISDLRGTITGNVFGSQMTIVPSGGSGTGYTFLWSVAENPTGQIVSGSATNATVNVIGTTGAVNKTLWKCRLTDSAGNVEDVYFQNADQS